MAERLFKRKKFIPDPMNTSALFAYFAQHFTHQFFKTDYYKGPGFTWGRHGIDLSNTYGHDLQRENMLRLFKEGKMKTQVRVFIALSTCSYVQTRLKQSRGLARTYNVELPVLRRISSASYAVCH